MKSLKSIMLLALLLPWSVAFGTSTRHAPDAVPASARLSVTEHAILVHGRPLHYRATAGYLPIASDTGALVARIFFVAYERLGEGTEPISNSSRDSNPQSAIRNPQSNRPLTFAFNGGPGASSVWLHMGAFGPKRALLADDGTALPPTNELTDNESTWLEFTDLVFVDPAGTGFSRPGPGVEAGQFYEVRRDIEIAAEFVRLFVTQHERWLSPHFIVAESYGTIRAVGMARRLQEHAGLYVNGLILLSCALNLGVISFDPGNDLPYALSLPSCTAVALYHGLLPAKPGFDLARSLQRVQAWALSDYLAALAQGAQLTPTESRQIAKRLAEYTGLPQDAIARNHLRIGTMAFAQELLSRDNQVLGLLDGRVTAPAAPSARRPWTDPSLFLVEGPFVAAFNSYVRTDLGFRTDLRYIFLSDRANEAWNWGPARQGYLNFAPTLAEAMTLDTRLRVFAAAGYYDLTTPFLGQQYVFNHLDLPDILRPHLTFHLYPTGHQIYTSPEALAQLTADVQAFIAR
jgi:carboxypeptidase C (cathepsin A)